MSKSKASSIADGAERASQTGVQTRSGASTRPAAPPVEEQEENSRETAETSETEQTSTERTSTTASEKTAVEEDSRRKKRAPQGKESRRKILEAEEKLAELKLAEARASLALAEAKLAREKAMLACGDEEGNEVAEKETDKVEEWLQGQTINPAAEEKEKQNENEEKKNENSENEPEHRKAEEKQKSSDITSLAAALTQAVRMSRDAPRFLQELPPFAGHSTGWLGYRAAYYETEEMFSHTENTMRLRRSLKGAALEAVESLLISQPEPRAVIQALERRFGRPDTLAMGEIQKIKALGRLSDSPRELCIFANKIANVVATLETLKKVHYMFNPELVKSIVEKLPPILRNKWYDFAARRKEDTSDLKKMTLFLNEEADKCSAYALPEETEPHPERPQRRRLERAFATEVSGRKRCPMCQNEHHLTECKQFLGTPVNERWNIAKKNRICFQCLRSNHRRGGCGAKRCSVNGCGMAHHRLLHHSRPPADQQQPTAPPQAMEAGEAATVEIVSSTNCLQERQAFLKVAPVTVFGKNSTRIDTYALMDDGSTVTLIDEDLAELLHLDGPRHDMWVQGLSDTKKYENSKKVSFKIRGRHCKEEYGVGSARTVKKLLFTPQKIRKEDLHDCAHLRGLEDHLMYENARPRILLGQDNWELLLALETKTGRRNQPVASHTRLGWVLHGYRSSHTQTIAFCGHTVAKKEEKTEDNMENMMKRFFDLESLGIEARKQKNDPEERALEILKKTSRRLPDGRFETALLWKDEKEVIPNNYNDAWKRLRSLEKKLDRDPGLKEKYEERINNLLESGYAVPAQEPPAAGRTWYLPHFAVCNPAKPKIRLVHDAAARSHGRSLNDMLLSGPDLLQSLPGVIMRFRRHSVAVTADIKEMFMRIRVRKEDRDALRFLWRGNEREEKPQEYQMASLIFGATSSPCTALYVKNKNAEEFQEKYPRAVAEIKKNHYMDDFISSFPSEEEALETSQEVDMVHRHAGFELRGWTSNSEAIRRRLGNDRDSKEVPVGEDCADKTLGIWWEAHEDLLRFNLNEAKIPRTIMSEERAPTKREALSVVMSLFDPLGLLSPLTMPAKKFMQETWRYGTGWDEPIPEQLVPKWTAWTRDLQQVRKIKIPRCYNLQPEMVSEMHTFVDASKEAYAAAVYIRMVREDGAVHTALVAAKSRVAPLKPTSIPRLELQAALLGTRLAKTVEKELEVELVRKTYWSDSRTVLAWIRAEPRAYKTFVAHRLAEIEETTKVSEWRWVPTKENVADDATRATPTDFGAAHRWFSGPEFLKKEEIFWPKEGKPAEKTDTGEEKCFVARYIALQDSLPDIERIGRWKTLIRATGRVLQFIDLCRSPRETVAAVRQRTKKNKEKDAAWDSRRSKKGKSATRMDPVTRRKYVALDARYLTRAEALWLRRMQEESYSKERKRIEENRSPAAGDRLASLSVHLEEGLIKLRGRVAAAEDISRETNNPVIMDGSHRYTKLYIQQIHEEMHHGGVEATVNEIRQRFWVTRIRPTVKGVIRACLACRIRRAKPTCPATGDLPVARLAHHARPYTFTGLDYFGPVEVTVGRHREKRWVALFTCLTMRAVHLEVVTSLSADSAIAALRRFVARRGQPTELWSDNATCFKAAEKELQQEWEKYKSEVNARRINWRYIPPSAPFMGGAWERLVRSVKESLRVTLHEQHPSDETLYTLLVEAENIINSRPLTYVSVDPEEPEALTPNHILLGSGCHVPAPGRFEEEKTSARQLWKRAQHLADVFWRRWVREYLPLLQHRREPHTRGSDPAVGDVVIICDSNLPRNIWPRGKIKRTYPGKDGVVRVVDVETANGHVLRRPTKKIVVLPGVSPARPAGEMCTTDSK
ncbi:uncharacterized protein LOC121729533 [Aricia agestis]|uniref:uncharacterized protein LOC121729533 n=1 Tax=Aricia agestis TaxID=91739 RepID=UPI001C201BDF|nr:uncharacterized protein LOC121729533 [Aricia agestis]